VQIADEQPEQYLWLSSVAPDKAFRLLASPELLEQVRLVPKGSVFFWTLPPEVLMGDAPPREGEFEAFRDFYKAHTIALVVYGNGVGPDGEPRRNVAPRLIPLSPTKFLDE
jgi:hypothetical protein